MEKYSKPARIFREVLIVTFGLFSVVLVLYWFSGIVSGALFWGVTMIASYFVFPALDIKLDISGLLRARTTLELLLLNAIVALIGWHAIPEYLKSVPDQVKTQLKNGY